MSTTDKSQKVDSVSAPVQPGPRPKCPMEQLAREFIEANRPEPLRCEYCGEATSFTPIAGAFANHCPKSPSGHMYMVTMGGNLEDAEVKRLVKFGEQIESLRRLVPAEPDIVTRLRCIGGKLRTNLHDAATIYPEHWSAEGVAQLITEWDEAVSDAVKQRAATTQGTPEGK